MAFLVILAVLVFIVLVLVSRIRIVPQANVYVVERLGAFYKAWGTGIHFLVPFIDRVAKRVSIKEQVVDFKHHADRHSRVLPDHKLCTVCIRRRASYRSHRESDGYHAA